MVDDNLESINGKLTTQSLVPIDVKEKNFQTLMSIYEKAMIQVKEELEEYQEVLKDVYQYDVISNINCRIKTPESIIKKMKKKNYNLNYKELIGNVNDVAGIRIVCPFKTDIAKIKDIIERDSKIDIIEVKDYINKPKKSGYSGLHLISQTPVNIGDTDAQVKIEIQIRTMAMDFWATTDHKIKYKAKNELSKIDSKRMFQYAKILNKIDEKVTKINAKYIN